MAPEARPIAYLRRTTRSAERHIPAHAYAPGAAQTRAPPGVGWTGFAAASRRQYGRCGDTARLNLRLRSGQETYPHRDPLNDRVFIPKQRKISGRWDTSSTARSELEHDQPAMPGAGAASLKADVLPSRTIRLHESWAAPTRQPSGLVE